LRKRPACRVNRQELQSQRPFSPPPMCQYRTKNLHLLSPRFTPRSTWCKLTSPSLPQSLTDIYHRTWIGFSGGVILFNKWLLDTLGFSM
jgi:hypothetical protein